MEETLQIWAHNNSVIIQKEKGLYINFITLLHYLGNSLQ